MTCKPNFAAKALRRRAVRVGGRGVPSGVRVDWRSIIPAISRWRALIWGWMVRLVAGREWKDDEKGCGKEEGEETYSTAQRPLLSPPLQSLFLSIFFFFSFSSLPTSNNARKNSGPYINNISSNANSTSDLTPTSPAQNL